MVEHEAHAAAGSERASALCEVASHIGYRTGVVVSRRLDEIGDSVRAVTLEHNLLEISLVLLKGSLDGLLDVVLRHVLASGLRHKGSEPGVADHVRSTLLYRDGDFLSDLGEGLCHVTPPLEFPFLSEFKRSSHIPYLVWFSMRVMYLSMS